MLEGAAFSLTRREGAVPSPRRGSVVDPHSYAMPSPLVSTARIELSEVRGTSERFVGCLHLMLRNCVK